MENSISSTTFNVCPICNKLFPMSELIDHSNKCVDQSMKSAIPEKPKEEDIPLKKS